MSSNDKKCCLCGCDYDEFGNNPFPLANEGKCCDTCNEQVVMARFKQDKGKGKDMVGDEDIGEDKVTWFKEPHHDMQLFVRTMSLGTIIVSAHHEDTIHEVAKRCRRILDAMIPGDNELMTNHEQIMIFTGKQLEDGRTLKDYNILDQSTLTMAWGLKGGGKRAKAIKLL